MTKKYIAGITLLIMMLVAVDVLGIVVTYGLWSRVPALVDPSSYDLTEINGQSGFAKAVNDIGAPGGATIFNLIVTVYTLIMTGAVVYTIAKKDLRVAIPRSIVRTHRGAIDTDTE